MRRRRHIVALVTIAAVVCVAPTGSAQRREVGEIERVNLLTRPAIVYLEMAWEGVVRDTRDDLLWLEDPIEVSATCSGSVVDPDGFVLTAGHCVDPGINGMASTFFETVVNAYIDSGEVDAANGDTFYQEVAENSVIEDANGDPIVPAVTVYRGVIESGERSGQGYDAQVLGYSTLTETDVALLKVEAEGLPAIEISDETNIGVGSPIVAIGYPGSVAEIIDPTLEPSVKEGTISAKRTIGGYPRYEISAASTQGMSGGPITDLDGRVLAVVSSAPASERQSFNFVAPVEGAEEMFEDNDVNNRLAPIDRPYRTALQHLFDGEFSDAEMSFDAVLEDDPKHQQAFELKAEASRRAAQADGGDGGGGGFPSWILAPIVLLGAAAYVLQRRRRPAPAPAGVAETPSPAGAGMQTSSEPPGVVPAPVASEAPSDGLTCPHCGNIAVRPVAFCTKCGRSMSADAPASSGATSGVPSPGTSVLSRNRWLLPAGIGAVVLVALVAVFASIGSDDGDDGPQQTAGLLGGTRTDEPADEEPSIAGTWDSNFGAVTLEHDAVSADLAPVEVTGSWEQGEGKHGEITSGQFDPEGGTLEISYVETWSKVEGTASFELTADGTTLSGTYEQPGSKGPWLLVRLAEGEA